MRAVVIGPGRVGSVLVPALTRAGHRVVAVAGGSDDARTRLQSEVAGLRACADPAEAVAMDDVELVLVAVPDDAIELVTGDLARRDAWQPGQRVVHLSGARGLGPLRRAELSGCRVAACHPAQTVSTGAGADALIGAAWAVTAALADRDWARELVVDLGGDPALLADDRRGLYHAGLVLGSNAVGAAVASARQILLAAGIEDPARFLRPLVDASIAGPLARGAVALTGPVVRGDVGTVARHLEILDRDLPHLAAIYRDLGRAVLAQTRPGPGDDVADRLRDLLHSTPDALDQPAES